jgi:Cu(I)/Ag(I) efflux system membrane fusion protein
MKQQIIITTITLLAGILLGWIFFHSSPASTTENHNHSSHEAMATIWTCSMHPQFKLSDPGKCPICAMDLIPLGQNSSSGIDPEAIQLTKEAAQLANVMTTVVTSNKAVKEVRLYGKVQADERLLQNQVAFVSGRIEQLHINFTGETVRKGQKLATIYSPELVTAQQELLETARSRMEEPALHEAAREKLLQWKLTEDQINAIEQSGKIQANIEILSTTGGIVTARRVNSGDYINQGSVLYEISDLSQVWIQFDAYESDLQFLDKGDKIDFTLQALPGTNYSGSIVFIDPTLDPVTRIAKVRVEISNLPGKLKPEMFATGVVKSNLNEYKDHLVIPKSAVLWTGKRSIVYVKIPGDEPTFKIREIGLGPVLGNSYVVTDGLSNGEEIVTEGAFSVDAAAQLEGKPSMMNDELRKSNGNSTDTPTESTAAISKDSLTKLSFKVFGSCEMCKERIESTAKAVSGVIHASWNSSNKLMQLEIEASKTNSDTIQKAIAAVGHDTEKYKAPDEVYKKLPECCLYRE